MPLALHLRHQEGNQAEAELESCIAPLLPTIPRGLVLPQDFDEADEIIFGDVHKGIEGAQGFHNRFVRGF